MPQQTADGSAERPAVAFRVGSNRLLAPLDQVAEILEFPEVSRVPLAQPWVRGVANVRGNLLPVVDLYGFLGCQLTKVNDKTRILVINHGSIHTGLVVDEVYGMKYFMEGERAMDQAETDECLLSYVQQAYTRNDARWSELDLFSIVDTPRFLQAAK